MSPPKKFKPMKPDSLVNVGQVLADYVVAHDNVASIHGAFPSLDEPEIVRRVLALAHDDPSVEEMYRVLEYSFDVFTHGVPAERAQSTANLRKLLRDLPDLNIRVLREWESVAEERHWFRKALSTIADGTRSDINKLRVKLPVTPPDVVVISKLNWTFSTLERADELACLSVWGICVYVIMLLLDGDRDLRHALRKCKLGCCGRYFLSVPSAAGGPRPSYCIPEHRELAAKLTGPERTARWRAKHAKKKRGKK